MQNLKDDLTIIIQLLLFKIILVRLISLRLVRVGLNYDKIKNKNSKEIKWKLF